MQILELDLNLKRLVFIMHCFGHFKVKSDEYGVGVTLTALFRQSHPRFRQLVFFNMLIFVRSLGYL